jgi:hypothetical protein
MARLVPSFHGRAPTTILLRADAGALGTAGRLVGHVFIHKGDDSGFVAERE